MENYLLYDLGSGAILDLVGQFWSLLEPCEKGFLNHTLSQSTVDGIIAALEQEDPGIFDQKWGYNNWNQLRTQSVAMIWEALSTLQADLVAPQSKIKHYIARKKFQEIFQAILDRKKSFMLGNAFKNITFKKPEHRFFLI